MEDNRNPMHIVCVGGLWFFVFGPIFITAASIDLLLNSVSYILRYATPYNQWVCTRTFNQALEYYNLK